MMVDADEEPGRIRLAPGVTVAESALLWSQSRSGGPGGQHVNKTESKAELRVESAQLIGLSAPAQARLLSLNASRLVAEGRLLLTCESTRSLRRNRDLALERLAELVLQAQAVPRPRKRTRPSRAAKQRRLEAKLHQSVRKRNRRADQD